MRATGAAGDITLNNAVTSGSAANDSLVLAAGRNFINNAGATPLNPGAGRFLVYSTDPTANTFGGFASTGNAFSRTYGANAPSDASMTSLSGNRMVYSVTPMINITGDNQAKVYGAAEPGLTYTVGSGLVAGDTAASALAGLLAAPTGSAASAGTHAITQGTLASALGYGIAYTNGTLTVDKATLTVSGVAANNKTYDGSAAATLGNIGTLSGLAYGEALTLNSTGASFADANAGTGKTVDGDLQPRQRQRPGQQLPAGGGARHGDGRHQQGQPDRHRQQRQQDGGRRGLCRRQRRELQRLCGRRNGRGAGRRAQRTAAVHKAPAPWAATPSPQAATPPPTMRWPMSTAC